MVIFVFYCVQYVLYVFSYITSRTKCTYIRDYFCIFVSREFASKKPFFFRKNRVWSFSGFLTHLDQKWRSSTMDVALEGFILSNGISMLKNSIYFKFLIDRVDKKHYEKTNLKYMFHENYVHIIIQCWYFFPNILHIHLDYQHKYTKCHNLCYFLCLVPDLLSLGYNKL